MSKLTGKPLKTLYHIGFKKPVQFYSKNREQYNDWDDVDIVVEHEHDKKDKSQSRKDILYPNFPNRPEFCHEEFLAYRWFSAKKIQNNLTKRCDPIWINELKTGADNEQQEQRASAGTENTHTDTLDLEFSIEGAGCVEIEKEKEKRDGALPSQVMADVVFKVPAIPKKRVVQKKKDKTNKNLMPAPVTTYHNDGDKENVPFGKPKSPMPGKKTTINSRKTTNVVDNVSRTSRSPLSSIENTSGGSRGNLINILTLSEASESLSIHKGHHVGEHRNRILSDATDCESLEELEATSVSNEEEIPHEEGTEEISTPTASNQESSSVSINTQEKSKINPFDNDFVQRLLGKVQIVDRLKQLKTCTFNAKIKHLAKGQSLDIGGDSFYVMKSITKGGFGTIFSANSKRTGKMYALKQERPPNLWEYYLCLELRERIKDREILPAFMSISHGLIGNSVSILVSPFSQYGSLLDVNNAVRVETGRCVDEMIVFCIAKQLLNIFSHLHKAQIIHADVKPDNFLWIREIQSPSSQQLFIQLIDFGCSIDVKLIKEEFSDFDGFSASLKKNPCTEMRDGRLWTYQLDYYGIAGTIHAMLFGEYMKVEKGNDGKWKLKMKIKRYFRQEIWENLFDKLLNIQGEQPDVKSLNEMLDQELQRKKAFTLKKIEEFNAVVSSKKK